MVFEVLLVKISYCCSCRMPPVVAVASACTCNLYVPDSQGVMIGVGAIAAPMNFPMMIVCILWRRSKGGITLCGCFLRISVLCCCC